ncbi:hypothetical protein DFH27DRAFT_572720 [Peziza echinospora]|nr:hypothetical protein DFH27DRAFT_572720 [Peziza echinospora]
MHPLFAKHGLVERQIQPDGHCLYSSFADQLGWLGIPLLPPPLHLEDTTSSSGGGTAELAQYIPLRRACAAYIRAHRADFAPFLEEDLDAHVAKVEGTAEWGGHTEVVALARAYGVVVNVVQAGGVERMNDEEVGGGGGEGGKEVWLAYYRHCYGLGEHYNSLRRRRREG